jgi:hypothetical protein
MFGNAQTPRFARQTLPSAPLAAALLTAMRSVAQTFESETMLRSTHDLKDYSIGATDGEIGDVDTFLIDEETAGRSQALPVL